MKKEEAIERLTVLVGWFDESPIKEALNMGQHRRTFLRRKKKEE